VCVHKGVTDKACIWYLFPLPIPLPYTSNPLLTTTYPLLTISYSIYLQLTVPISSIMSEVTMTDSNNAGFVRHAHRCPSCGRHTPLPEYEGKFCPSCGTKQGVGHKVIKEHRCPNCNKEYNPINAYYCKHCSFPLYTILE